MDAVSLLTAQKLEEALGQKYFYRQRIYRLGQSGVIPYYEVGGIFYFSEEDVIWAFLDQLAERIRSRFSFDTSSLRVWYENKSMFVYGFPEGRSVAADTDKETEEDLLGKVEKLGKEVNSMAGRPVEPHGPHHPPPPPHGHPPHHPPGPGPEEHHREVMDALDRVEAALARIEQKLE